MARGIFIVAYFSTGVVTAHFLSRVLDDTQREKLQMTCVDVNEQALKGIISISGSLNLFPAFFTATVHTLKCNGFECCRVTCMRSDLFDALSDNARFDVILFNPPYVPTDEEELNRAQAACGAGGLCR